LLRAGTLLLAMGIIVGIYLVVGKDQIQRFQEYGYFGIFLTSLIGNASIAMPIPSLFFTFMGGGTFNWVIVGLVSGAGEALGESTGYLVGYGGSFIIENRKIYKRMHYFMENHGMLTIFVLSVIPNPLIDLAGIAAGASKYGYLKFLVACWAGKTIKTLAFAWAGAHSVTWLLDLVNGWI
jgi:membrane protein DedA with SNARE-associated domain